MAITILPLTILSGQSISAPLSISTGLKIARIAMPPEWDSAPLTFLISLDEGNGWLDLYHAAEGTSGMYAPYETGVQSVVANSILSMPSDMGASIGWLKIRSGTKSKPVVQTADRVFAIMFE
jgi:hypothetical protein